MTPAPLTSPAPHSQQPLPGFVATAPNTPPAGGPLATYYIIPNFVLTPQQQSNWCWLATTTDVHNYYHPPQSVTQCSLAGTLLSMQCCTNPGPCNQPGWPSIALQTLQNLAGSPQPISTLSYPAVQNQLNANHPIVVGYTNPGLKVGHAVLILGYADSPGKASQVYIGDPANGYFWTEFATILFTYAPFNSQVCFTQP